MGRLLNVKRVTLMTAALMLLGIGLLPLSLVILSSFRLEGELSLRNYVEVFGNARTWALFRNSLALAVLTTAVAGTVGVTLGILVAKTDLLLRNAFALL